MIMRENIDKWLRTKSKNRENYVRNLELINTIDDIESKLKYNSKDDIIALTGFIFDFEGNIKPISAVDSFVSRSPKRSSRGSENGQYMQDLIDNIN
jgi:predicted MPP superfamily phosphohydrolase